MRINLKDTNSFKPCPEGLKSAVCADVVDLGLKEDTFQGKTKTVHKIRLVWQVDEVDEDTGRRFLVSKTYNLSGHKKSNLRKDLEVWRGKPFAQENGMDEFELEDLVGVNCQLSIAHKLMPDGEVWTLVQAIVPAAKGAPRLAVKDYTRKKDRVEGQAPAASGPTGTEPDDDEEVPF